MHVEGDRFKKITLLQRRKKGKCFITCCMQSEIQMLPFQDFFLSFLKEFEKFVQVELENDAKTLLGFTRARVSWASIFFRKVKTKKVKHKIKSYTKCEACFCNACRVNCRWQG